MIVGQDFKILTELGAGGMGIVYQGVDNLEREVAIKRLRSEFSGSTDVSERFRREAKIQAQLNHPNLAHLYRFFKDGDSFYIVMEFVDGIPIGRLTPFGWEHAVSIFLQILEGLESAHSQGVLHRDIKPDNIMISPRGDVKVMDFGIAHVLGSTRHTRDHSIIGTLDYIPPEQISGKEIGPSSDIYSLGCVLFEMIAGRPPFVAEVEFALLHHHLETPAPSLSSVVPNVPAFLDEAVARALRKSATERFGSCVEFGNFLREHAPAVAAASPDSFPRRIHPDEVERCVRRIDSLIQGGEIETAFRVLARATRDYPGQEPITQANTRLRSARQARDKASNLGEKTEYLRGVFKELRELQGRGDMEAASRLTEAALERFPSVPALLVVQRLMKERK